MGMSLPDATVPTPATQSGEGGTDASSGSSTNFGGPVNAPANAIAVGAIGNTFATSVDFDGLSTTAEVIPVNSSADFIEGDGAATGASPRVQRILDRVNNRTPATATSGPPQLPMSGQLISE